MSHKIGHRAPLVVWAVPAGESICAGVASMLYL